MGNQYKLTLSNQTLYREVDLTDDMDSVTIGTAGGCDVRLRKELFFDTFELQLTRRGDKWEIICSESVYISVDQVRRLMVRELSHGDHMQLLYRSTDNELLTIDFEIDFESEVKDYHRVIDLGARAKFQLGTDQGSDILLSGGSLRRDILVFQADSHALHAHIVCSTYGVCKNGQRVTGSDFVLHDRDFFSIGEFSFYYRNGAFCTSAVQQIAAPGLSARIESDQTSHFTYPDFNRSTRLQYVIPEEEVEVKQPPSKPQQNQRGLLVTILPALAMLVLLVVVRGFMSTGTGGMSFILYSAGSMLIGVIVSLITYFGDKKRLREQLRTREEQYNAYIEEKETGIQAQRSNELRIRRLIYSSLSEDLSEAVNFQKRLFEKDVHDPDFLEVYLGTGTIESNCRVKFNKQDFVDPDDPISMLPEQLADKYRYISDAPIIAQFKQAGAVGVVGSNEGQLEALKNFTLDIALRHFYKDVKLFYMLDEADLQSMSWLRWLQHVHNDTLNIRNFICDDESRKVLTEQLYSILSAREAQQRANDGADEFSCHYVVFVRGAQQISKHPLSKFVERCAQYGFTFVFFEEYEEFLPKGCGEIIRLGNAERSDLILKSKNGDVQCAFVPEHVEETLAAYAAAKIGAVCVPELSLESELTRNITLFDLLNIFSVEDLDLEQRWGQSEVYRSMAAPLGVKAKQEVVYLDISDKASAHGPHGLVAGTTGSGKSEILQTYVLSMATLFHPHEVAFMIIDFKGGGMASQFRDLPHMLGTITNIDGREIDRSLRSIKAELVKRQALFAQASLTVGHTVNHINDYIRLYKKGVVSEPIPHLIIIADEFAELKAEYPDFMKEIISAARIGRTLGIHLILATQKPAGVVDNQIWSNSKFRLCLKVQTKEDSNEVIKTPLAAEIKEPGRAYFQVGNNEVFELFQSAYSGAKVVDASERQPVTLYELNLWGKRSVVYTNKNQTSAEDAPTELKALVDYIHDYCEHSHISKLNGICLPALPDVLDSGELHDFRPEPAKGIVVPIGVYDDPDNQRQENYVINLSADNTYIIGSAQTGKTTLLQTIILQIMQLYSPQECSIYVVDCGAMALKTFEASNHVGGVAVAAEEERVANLLKMLTRLVQQRKEKFAEQGLGTYAAYVEAGFRDLPQVLLVIDNYAAFREYYGSYDETILFLSREGQGVGLSLIITATQTNALNYKTLSNYGTRIAYSCNDSGEYMNLFDRCKVEPKDVPGRGLCSLEKHIVEFQTALCVEGDKEIDRVQNIRERIAATNADYAGVCAAPIPEVPAVLRMSELAAAQKTLYQQPYRIPIGMDYDEVSYRTLDLLTVGSFAIVGRPGSGRSNFIRHLLTAIRMNVFGSLTSAYIVDNAEMKLEACGEYGFVERYGVDENDGVAMVEEIYERLVERQAMLTENRGTAPEQLLADEPLLLLVVNNRGFYRKMGEDKETYKLLLEILKTYRRLKVTVVFADVDNQTPSYSGPDIFKQIKEAKQHFFFEDAANIKAIDLTVKQQKEQAKPLKTGDAFMAFGTELCRIKTILMDQ